MEAKKDDYMSLFVPAMSEITEKGIKYRDKYYSCQWAIRNQWFQLSSSTRMLRVFVDTLNDDYLLITLENGCLDVALQIQHYKINTDRLDEYYQLLNNIKKQIKERKRKRT
ncbi:hypothetical protein [Paenibacillus terrigena]|uniref:hypothetical protein n=1 Tax=Paenibacillus terrigena TaxID=369333 RepID=UPI0003694586|nr:hypothetical protein [Paenibacillus terrigena]